MRELSVVTDDGVVLSGEDNGPGEGGRGGDGGMEAEPPVVLLHGLTATRRYVTMGSNVLARAGRRTIAYDARGHGRSSAAPSPDAYSYDRLAADLLAVLDALDVERAVLAGVSMGAHTAVRFALDHTDRVAGLALTTPAFDPQASPDLAGWDALARGLRDDGVEGFVGAYDLAAVPERWRETVEKVIRQRLAAHANPLALADALEAVPRSWPFERWSQLAALEVPAVVIASRDEADPGHPLVVAERYAATLPAGRLEVEPPGRSPLAWQGGRVSRIVAELRTR